MPSRIGLIGAECSGKSALALALAEELPGLVATEVLRQFVADEGRTPRADEQRMIMERQQAREDALAVSGVNVVIGDPAALMTAVYSVAYFGDESLLPEGIRLAQGYDLLVWCDIDLPWQPDGMMRDGVDMQRQVHHLIGDLLGGPHALPPVMRASGSVNDRVTAVRRAWQQPAPSEPT